MIAVATDLGEGQSLIIAKDQPEYLPLPATIVDRDEGVAVVTRWRFADEERAAIANGADLYLELLTFGQPLQPIRICVGDAPRGN